MAGGGTKTTTNIDPKSQQYVSGTRQVGAGGANSILRGDGTLYSPETMSVQDQAMRFMNPWFSQVLDPVNQSFDRALAQNRMGVNDAAQGAGAFGSARHGVAQAVGMGEVERGRAQVLGNLLNNQWQTAVGQGLSYQRRQRELERMQAMDPYLRSQMAVGLRNQSLGPTGQVQTQKQQGNTFGQILGAGLGIAGSFMGGGPLAGLFSAAGGGGGEIPMTGGGSAPVSAFTPSAQPFGGGIPGGGYTPPPGYVPGGPRYSQPGY